MREVVSFLRCVVTFFYFSTEQIISGPAGPECLKPGDVWLALQSVTGAKARHSNRETKVRLFLWETPSAGQWWQNSGLFLFFIYINRFIDFAHRISEPNCSVCCRKTHLWAISFKWVNMWDSHCFTSVISLKISALHLTCQTVSAQWIYSPWFSAETVWLPIDSFIVFAFCHGGCHLCCKVLV